MFAHISGAAITHIPYKGAAPAMNALLSGEVEIAFPGREQRGSVAARREITSACGDYAAPVIDLADLPTLDSIYPGIDVDSGSCFSRRPEHPLHRHAVERRNRQGPAAP